MCIERVLSLQTAPTRNFDGVMLVLIRYLVQPVRRGNATHQVHRRRDVSDQNFGVLVHLGTTLRQSDHTRTEV